MTHDGEEKAKQALFWQLVQQIAQRHRATVELGDGPDGRGLAVTVRFPKR